MCLFGVVYRSRFDINCIFEGENMYVSHVNAKIWLIQLLTDVISVTWKSGWGIKAFRATMLWILWGRCPRLPGSCRWTKPQTTMQQRSSRDATSSHRFRCKRCSHSPPFLWLLICCICLLSFSPMRFQIVKILNSYTPIDDFEKRVAPSFVRKVQASPLLTDHVTTCW